MMPSGRRILHVIPTLEGGGAEHQLALLVREQVARGNEVHVALRRAGAHADRGYLRGAHLHMLGDLRWASPRLIFNAYRLIRRLGPDIVQTWLPQADVCGGVAARMARVPWIMSERSAPAEYVGRQILEWLRRRVARTAAAIVANSGAGALYWQRQRGAETEVVTVGNALDLDAIASSARAGMTRPVDEPSLVLSVGSLVENKVHRVAIAAWAQAGVDSAQLRIHGDGPLREVLVAQAERLGVSAGVQILPFRMDWWTLLGRARLLLSLSRYEGAPNVVLEAMAAGVPLVVSDIPAHRELLDETCALFVPLDDVAATAAAIRESLSDPCSSSERVDEAVRRAQRKTIATAADNFEAVYDRVLLATSRRAAQDSGD